MSLRIGVDVEGTNSDAVLMDVLSVVGKTKTPTTPDVTTGIATAMRRVLSASAAPTSAISGAMIGTTHFTNAVVERQHLEPTAAIRLGLPATPALPPPVEWPDDLADVLGRHVYLCLCGHEIEGLAIAPLDAGETSVVTWDIAAKGITAVAVTSVFSPANHGMEEGAAAIIRTIVPGAQVTISSDIGRVGLLERENAAILNACLGKLAKATVVAFRQAITELGIAAPLYLTQNDGTLMSADSAERLPVLTFASDLPTRCAEPRFFPG